MGRERSRPSVSFLVGGLHVQCVRPEIRGRCTGSHGFGSFGFKREKERLIVF